jgi:hypothetical protein
MSARRPLQAEPDKVGASQAGLVVGHACVNRGAADRHAPVIDSVRMAPVGPRMAGEDGVRVPRLRDADVGRLHHFTGSKVAPGTAHKRGGVGSLPVAVMTEKCVSGRRRPGEGHYHVARHRWCSRGYDGGSRATPAQLISIPHIPTCREPQRNALLTQFFHKTFVGDASLTRWLPGGVIVMRAKSISRQQ